MAGCWTGFGDSTGDGFLWAQRHIDDETKQNGFTGNKGGFYVGAACNQFTGKTNKNRFTSALNVLPV